MGNLYLDNRYAVVVALVLPGPVAFAAETSAVACRHFPWIEQPEPFFRDVSTFLSGRPR
jgi:hypothetical protein